MNRGWCSYPPLNKADLKLRVLCGPRRRALGDIKSLLTMANAELRVTRHRSVRAMSRLLFLGSKGLNWPEP